MRMSRLLVGGAAALLLVATAATPSGAVWDPGLGGSRGTGSNTNLVLSGIGPGQGVTGWIGPVGSISNPANPYPTGDPPDPSFTSQDESFAGIILATPPGGGSALEMYCIR